MLCACSMFGTAAVNVTFTKEKPDYEYYSAMRLWPNSQYVVNSDEDEYFDISQNATATFKMRVRGDFFERWGYTPYQTSEWRPFRFASSYTFINLTNEEQYLKMRAVIEQNGNTIHDTGVRTAKLNVPTSEQGPIIKRLAWLGEEMPNFDEFKNDEFYDITYTFSHEVKENLTIVVSNEIREDLADCVATADDDSYATVVTRDGQTVNSTATVALGMAKYCNNIYSGTINFMDQSGSTELTSDEQAQNNEAAQARQPHGYPIVRLYDINAQEWVQIARQNEAEGFMMHKPSYAPANQGHYMLNESDSTVARYGFTSENYCEMELNDGKFRFNSGPLDYSHNYLLVVASYSAGYAAVVWNFESGAIKTITRMADLDNYELPTVSDEARKNKWKVDIDMTLNPTTTGITDVDSDLADVPATYYDLTGRQASTPFPGVNIVKRGNQVTKQVF